MNEHTKKKEQLFLEKIKDGLFELCDDGVRNTKTNHVYVGRLVSMFDSGQVYTIGQSKLQYMIRHKTIVPDGKLVWKGKLRDCTSKLRSHRVDNTKLSKAQIATLRKKLANNVGLDLSVVAMNEGISQSCVKRALSGVGEFYGAVKCDVEHDIIGKVNLNKFRVGSIKSANALFTNKEANEIRERFLSSDMSVAEFLNFYPDNKEVVRSLLKNETYVFADDVSKKTEAKYKKLIKKC